MSLRLRDLPLDPLLPPDVHERTAKIHVGELAESIDSVGLIHPVTVDARTGQLICGADRVAAFVLLGRKTIPAFVVDVEDVAQVEEMRIVENLRRRVDDRNRMLAELAEASRLRTSATRPANSAPSGHKSVSPDESPHCANSAPTGHKSVSPEPAAKGRPKTLIGKGREMAAALASTTPQAVRRAEQKTAAKKAPAPAPKQAPEPCIKTLGLAVPPGLLEEVARLQAVVDEHLPALRKVKLAARALDHQLLDETLQSAEWHLKQSRPASVCPHCKLLAQRQPDCTFCRGVGWVDEAQLSHVDQALLAEGPDAGIFVQGRFRKLSELKS